MSQLASDEVSNNPEKEHGYGLEGAAFGLADGVICFLGIIMGVAEATRDVRMIVISSIVGGIADAIGNSFGFFISQLAERGLQVHQKEEHNENVRVHSRKEVLMSGVFSFGATIFALVILIFPFFFFSLVPAMVSSFSIGTIGLLILGGYVGKMSKESPLKTGLKFALLGIVGAVISYLIGAILGHLTSA